MGHGSSMTFVSHRALLTEDVKELMGAVRLVFVDENYNIISYAGLDETTYSGDGVNHTMKLRLYEYKNGEFVKKTTTETVTGENNTETTQTVDSLSLMPLNQNEVTRLSVIVYLDGNVVDNSMVATDGYSLDGTLNLQFASDAELKAMNYSAFNVEEETTPDDDATDNTGTEGN